VQARQRARKQWRNALAFAAAFALGSCGPAGPQRSALVAEPLPVAGLEPVGTTVVLVTIDGARREEVFRGVDATLARAHGLRASEELDARALVPNLSALMVEYGAAFGAPALGSEIRASGPNFVSLPGYTELLTGRAPPSCADNACGAVREPTLADDISARFGCSPETTAVVTSWPDIGRVAAQHPECTTMSSGRHGGFHLERFRPSAPDAARFDAEGRADPFPGHGDFRPDHLTGARALDYLERYEPRFLFLGLGETDEYAHRDDYRGYLTALTEADRWVGAVARALGRLAERGRRTALFVTADHGRARSFVDHGAAYPESADVWLVAAGTEIVPRGFAAGGRLRHLADVTPTARRLLGLAPDRSERAGRALFEILPDAQSPARVASGASNLR